jgi:hypothetical protein
LEPGEAGVKRTLPSRKIIAAFGRDLDEMPRILGRHHRHTPESIACREFDTRAF